MAKASKKLAYIVDSLIIRVNEERKGQVVITKGLRYKERQSETSLPVGMQGDAIVLVVNCRDAYIPRIISQITLDMYQEITPSKGYTRGLHKYHGGKRTLKFDEQITDAAIRDRSFWLLEKRVLYADPEENRQVNGKYGIVAHSFDCEDDDSTRITVKPDLPDIGLLAKKWYDI